MFQFIVFTMTTVRTPVFQKQWSLHKKKKKRNNISYNNNDNNNNNVEDLVVCLSRVLHVATQQGNAFSVKNFSHCLISSTIKRILVYNHHTFVVIKDTAVPQEIYRAETCFVEVRLFSTLCRNMIYYCFTKKGEMQIYSHNWCLTYSLRWGWVTTSLIVAAVL
jgi:hypothetical protein